MLQKEVCCAEKRYAVQRKITLLMKICYAEKYAAQGSTL